MALDATGVALDATGVALDETGVTSEATGITGSFGRDDLGDFVLPRPLFDLS